MTTARPYEAVPPEAADVLRPVLPGLADETIAAIAREVPGYARAMEGEFGQAVRLGVEIAFSRFLDLVAAPEPRPDESARIYVDLGRGEFHAGRSLDALLAAYRVGGARRARGSAARLDRRPPRAPARRGRGRRRGVPRRARDGPRPGRARPPAPPRGGRGRGPHRARAHGAVGGRRRERPPRPRHPRARRRRP